MIFNQRLALQKCQNLADEIVEKIPLDPFVYDAFSQTPRELFVPNGMERHAYKLEALPMSGNQWISSPLTVAIMTDALDLKDVDNILEIGCGSGYQAAILSHIVRRVFTIERIEILLKEAKERFSKLNLSNIHARFDDGQRGWKSYAPYERILFSASAKSIPKAIFEQLKDGGVLVAPIEEGEKQVITRFTKNGDTIQKESLQDCLFVPVVDGVER